MLKELCLLPNLITLSRVGLTVPVAFILFSGFAEWWLYAIALVLCIIAAITDGIDGYLARKRGEVSTLGAALDPVADKIFLLWVMAALAVPSWLLIAVVTRDIIVTMLRSFFQIETSELAKTKTAVLFIFVIISIFMLMLSLDIDEFWQGQFMLFFPYINFTHITLALTVATGWQYLFATWKKLKAPDS